MPDIGTDPLPEAMEFDPSAAPPRVPEPIFIAQTPGTGVIDLALAGVEVPEDCSALDPMAIAQCEFNRYLETLPGFPTLTPAKAPSTAAVDLGTATLGDTVLVIDAAAGTAVPDVTVGYDETALALTIDPAKGWDVGKAYVLAVRGYADGVRSEDGTEMVAGPIFALLRSTESLTCGAATAEEVAPDCKFYVVLEADLGDDTAGTLLQLDAIRQAMAAMKVFELAEAAGLPRAQTAVLWAFSTHPSPVIELDPTRGLAPVVAGSREIRMGFKGTIDPATATPWGMWGNATNTGTVFLLDLTALAVGDMLAGLPPFAVTLDGQEMVLTADADLAAGHTFGILVTTAVTDDKELALAPSPLTVLLRSSGALLTEDGKSTVSGVNDDQAAQLEPARQELALLLSDPQFSGLTGLTRENLAFVFSFDLPGAAPAPGGDR
jgi:hypothetical protein